MNIWVNGCFDILHIGHIKLLEYAKNFGDNLIVGIDSDRRVSELKGDDRPFNNETIRKEFLESIKFVNKVVVFDNELELKNHLITNKINCIVIGDEYENKNIVGSDIVSNVYFFKKLPNLSTTNILKNGTKRKSNHF
jgi:rfaE bifunctional protein nucleotidyltransferase chain/domain